MVAYQAVDQAVDPWLAQCVENLGAELTGDASVLFESSLQLAVSLWLALRRVGLSWEGASDLTDRHHGLQIWWKTESLVDLVLCSTYMGEQMHSVVETYLPVPCFGMVG